jgi:hypothetical protein
MGDHPYFSGDGRSSFEKKPEMELQSVFVESYQVITNLNVGIITKKDGKKFYQKLS